MYEKLLPSITWCWQCLDELVQWFRITKWFLVNCVYTLCILSYDMMSWIPRIHNRKHVSFLWMFTHKICTCLFIPLYLWFHHKPIDYYHLWFLIFLQLQPLSTPGEPSPPWWRCALQYCRWLRTQKNYFWKHLLIKEFILLNFRFYKSSPKSFVKSFEPN